jgi:deoxyuridine 5'-triphosphate nucleotidohydrolase
MQGNMKDLFKQVDDLQNYLKGKEDEIDYNIIYETYGVDIKQLEQEMLNYVPKQILGYTKLNPDAIDPSYNYISDSGFDLYSTEEIVVNPLGRALIPTGLAFDIKDGYEIQVRSKSGLAINQGLFVLNSPGTVDCFSEDMKILTINGEKHIKDLKINDIVFSFNEKSLEIEKDIVLKIFDTNVQDILKIETEEGVLEVTPNSEIYTNKGIVLAKDLQENDEIIVFF